MTATTLDCPSCAAPLDVPPERTQFFCSFCGATVVVPESLRGGPSPSDSHEDAPLEPPPAADTRPDAASGTGVQFNAGGAKA